MRIAGLLVVLACSAPTPTAPMLVAPTRGSGGDVGVGSGIAALTCDAVEPRSLVQSYLSAQVVHVRVTSASPGPTQDGTRCVALGLEVVGVVRGQVALGQRVELVIRQSTIEHYTSRPAGAWWIVEQTLAPGSEYVALCPAGALENVLKGSCVVWSAPPHLAGMQLVRDAEARQLAGGPLIAMLRDHCATADALAAGYVLERLGPSALDDLVTFDAVLAVVAERRCTADVRGTLLSTAFGFATAREAAPHLLHLARTMFALLAMPEAAMLQDNLVAWLTLVIGLDGAMPTRLPASTVFAGDPTSRAAATRALAAYRGSTDATKLRAWLR